MRRSEIGRAEASVTPVADSSPSASVLPSAPATLGREADRDGARPGVDQSAVETSEPTLRRPAKATTVVELGELDGVPVARLRGEADAAGRGRIEDQLLEAVADHPAGLVVDLSGLRYLDSSAVRSLFVVADRLAARGGQLHVAVPRDSRLVRLLQIIQLDAVVQVHDSVAAAGAALADDDAD